MDLTVGIVTDLHFGRQTRFRGKLRKLTARAPALARAFVREMNESARPDLVVNLGDDIEDESREADLRRYAACQAILRRSRCPVVNVAGNHDTIHLSDDDLRRAWGRKGPLFYSLHHGGWHLVVLRTVERQDVDVRVDAEQVAWLREDLRADARPVLVFMHHPASEQDMTGSRWFEGRAHLALVRERAALRAVLEQSGRVRAVLNGHVHRNHLDVVRGIPYVTIQSLVENVEDDAPGTAAAAWAVVRASERRIVVQVAGVEPATYEFHP